MEQDPTEELVDALAVGEAVADGHFTLDGAAARAKLRERQLGDPHVYVLLLVEAAYLLAGSPEAGGIAFELGGTSVARFAGLSLDIDALADPFAAVFAPLPERPGPAQRRARALRLLGLAVHAALATGALAVELESVDEHGEARRARIEAEAQGPAQVEARGRGQPGDFCFSCVGRGLDRRRASYERDLLFSRCRYTSFEVLVSDERFSLGPVAALPEDARDSPKAIRFRRQGVVGVAARGAQPKRAKAIILTRGVLAEVIGLDGCAPGFVAVVDVDLRKDLSMRQLVRDADYEALLRAIRRSHDALPQQRRRSSSAGEVEELPRRQLALVLALIVLPIPLGLALISMRGGDPPDPRFEQLHRACEACGTKDEQQCTRLAAQLDAPSDPAASIERRLADGCERGHVEACHAAATSPTTDPVRAQQFAARACELGCAASCSETPGPRSPW